MEVKKIEQEYLSGFLANKLPRVLATISVVGFLVSLFFFWKDSHHYMFSYLTSFVFFMTLTLGSMFFVVVQMVTRAGWSVVVRRVPEVLMTSIPLMALFFIPVLLGIKGLYHWTDAHHVQQDHLLHAKSPYLNIPFFVIRVLVFFGIWHWISKTFFKNSVAQDTDGDGNRTLKLQKYATFSIILFALSLTFAFVDWVMSLTPHWYSTIFGVYFFAGSVLVALTVTSLLYLLLRHYGFLKSLVSVEHFHDLGKLMYGFNIFWSYIAFCQFFLIWYANIPEETLWYHMHFAGTWSKVAAFLAIGHFAVPFVLFMSRHAKRNLKFHTGIALWIVFMHLLDMYWVIMPNVVPKGLHVALIDILLLVSMGSGYFAYFFYRLGKQGLVPIKDPRIDESVRFHNV